MENLYKASEFLAGTKQQSPVYTLDQFHCNKSPPSFLPKGTVAATRNKKLKNIKLNKEGREQRKRGASVKSVNEFSLVCPSDGRWC